GRAVGLTNRPVMVSVRGPAPVTTRGSTASMRRTRPGPAPAGEPGSGVSGMACAVPVASASGTRAAATARAAIARRNSRRRPLTDLAGGSCAVLEQVRRSPDQATFVGVGQARLQLDERYPRHLGDLDVGIGQLPAHRAKQ